MPYELAFVNSIASSPTTRLDLHTTTGTGWQCLAEGTEFSAPPFDRVVAESMLANGGSVPSAVYRNRSVTLELELPMSLTPDASATLIQSLVRELDRPEGNFIRYRADTTAPLFFKTFRSGPTALQWDPFMRRAVVTLMAEPGAYGVEEVLSDQVVTNNPASSMFFDITSPKGDIETPLHLKVSNGVVGFGRLRSGIAVRRRGTVANYPLWLQAEAMLGTGTTTPGADAAMSGAGSNYVRIGFGTISGMSQRLVTNTRFPATASVDARGTYRVFARYRQSVAADLFQMQLEWGGLDVRVTNDVVTLPTGTGAGTIRYADLGEVQIPVGYDPVTRGPSGVEIPTEGVQLLLRAGRPAGTSANTLDVDGFLLWPADERSMFVDWPEQATVTDFMVTGGVEPSVYARNASAQIVSTQAVKIAGGGPLITPGRTNRVFFARDLGYGTSLVGTGDSITATTTLTPSYFPQYVLQVRPAAT